MITKDRSTSNLAFTIFALMLYSFCAALAVGGIVRVYNISLAYEHSNSEYLAQHVLELFKDKHYSEIIEQSEIVLSEFETPAAFGKALEKDFPEGDFALDRTDSDNWCISSDGSTLANFELCRESGSGKYGMDTWKIGKLDVIAPVQKTYTVQTPLSVQISINGIVPDDRYLAESDYAENPFGALPEALAPQKVKTYRLDNLFSPPDVSAQSEIRKDCEIAIFKNNVSVSMLPDQQIITQLSTFGEQAACAYSKYITNDAVLDEVLPFFLPESEYYTYLKQFYNGWYNAHDAFAFSNTEFSNWCAYDDRHVSCDISFDYFIKMGRHEYTYPSKYTMYFVLGDYGWRVANLVVL